MDLLLQNREKGWISYVIRVKDLMHGGGKNERERERDNGLTTNTYRAYRYAQKQYHIVVVSNHYQLALVVVDRSIAAIHIRMIQPIQHCLAGYRYRCHLLSDIDLVIGVKHGNLNWVFPSKHLVILSNIAE